MRPLSGREKDVVGEVGVEGGGEGPCVAEHDHVHDLYGDETFRIKTNTKKTSVCILIRKSNLASPLSGGQKDVVGEVGVEGLTRKQNLPYQN